MSINCTLENVQPKQISARERLQNFVQAKIQELRATMKKRRNQKTDREAFQHLLTLDDTMLDDIGVSRADVEWANSLPLHKCASRELEYLARKVRPGISI